MKKQKKKFKKESYLSAQFETERLKILNKAVATGAILAAILVPLFSLLDLVLKFYIFWTFFEIRIAVVLISIAVLFLTRTPFGKKHPYPLGGFLTLVVGGSIALMCYLDQGPVDPYYAGINLPLLGFGILLPLSMGEGIVVFTLVWISYFVPNLLRLHPGEIGIFVSNNFFMVSTILIALVSSQFHLYYRRKEWYSRHRLESAHRKIKNHAKELEDKVKVKKRTQKLLQTERLTIVGELAGGIAHDFNNILTAILGASGMLLSSLPKKDPMREEIESISRVGKRGARLVKQLLAFSRKQILIPKTLNINDVIKDVGTMLRRLIKEDIDLVINLSPNLDCVQADPIQIEQIILNLSLNARDAMPDGGKLIIKTDNVVLDKAYCKLGKVTLSPGQYVMLTVSDTGIGMTEEIKAKIFEPFFTTKEKGEGTGLGLSSVYGIVKQSKGDIVVYSEKGEGTTFKIYLPRVAQSTESTYNEEGLPSKSIRGKETILLVEDEDDVRTLTARVLEKQGYKVVQAREGNDALALADWYKGKIDLLLTDVSMPYMNGKSLAERLKGKRADIKVLFMSGYADRRLIPPGIINSNAAFLPKPYTAEALCYKIRSVIDNN